MHHPEEVAEGADIEGKNPNCSLRTRGARTEYGDGARWAKKTCARETCIFVLRFKNLTTNHVLYMQAAFDHLAFQRRVIYIGLGLSRGMALLAEDQGSWERIEAGYPLDTRQKLPQFV